MGWWLNWKINTASVTITLGILCLLTWGKGGNFFSCKEEYPISLCGTIEWFWFCMNVTRVHKGAWGCWVARGLHRQASTRGLSAPHSPFSACPAIMDTALEAFLFSLWTWWYALSVEGTGGKLSFLVPADVICFCWLLLHCPSGRLGGSILVLCPSHTPRAWAPCCSGWGPGTISVALLTYTLYFRPADRSGAPRPSVCSPPALADLHPEACFLFNLVTVG